MEQLVIFEGMRHHRRPRCSSPSSPPRRRGGHTTEILVGPATEIRAGVARGSRQPPPALLSAPLLPRRLSLSSMSCSSLSSSLPEAAAVAAVGGDRPAVERLQAGAEELAASGLDRPMAAGLTTTAPRHNGGGRKATEEANHAGGGTGWSLWGPPCAGGEGAGEARARGGEGTRLTALTLQF
ncbi:unnamed protein product [Urochloa humidicola]